MRVLVLVLDGSSWHAPVDEDSPLWDGDPNFDPDIRRCDPDAYGPLKVGCEIACRDAFGAEWGGRDSNP